MNMRNEAHLDRLDMFSEDQLIRYAGYHARLLFASFGWDITEHDGGMDFLSFKSVSPETGRAYDVLVFYQRDGFDSEKICIPFDALPGENNFPSDGIIVYEEMLRSDYITEYLFPTTCWESGDGEFKTEGDGQGGIFLVVDMSDPLENGLMNYYFRQMIYRMAPLLPGERYGWKDK